MTAYPGRGKAKEEEMNELEEKRNWEKFKLGHKNLVQETEKDGM